MSSRICIIGAGPAGLVAARALAERGLAYTHLERNARLGGVWDIDAPGSPMYESAHLTRLGFQKPTHRLFETHPIMNDQLLHHVRHGDVTPRPGIRSAEGKRITFTDGTSDEFDLVLLAIGYRRSVPFAQELFGDPQHPDNLYLDAFSTQHPGLCAVGFIESNSSSYRLLDRQAYLVAGYLAERAAGSEKAARFEERIRHDRPDLTSGIKFDASPRHQGYVDADAFVAHTDAVAAEFGWERTALKKTKGGIRTAVGRPAGR